MNEIDRLLVVHIDRIRRERTLAHGTTQQALDMVSEILTEVRDAVSLLLQLEQERRGEDAKVQALVEASRYFHAQRHTGTFTFSKVLSEDDWR